MAPHQCSSQASKPGITDLPTKTTTDTMIHPTIKLHSMMHYLTPISDGSYAASQAWLPSPFKLTVEHIQHPGIQGATSLAGTDTSSPLSGTHNANKEHPNTVTIRQLEKGSRHKPACIRALHGIPARITAAASLIQPGPPEPPPINTTVAAIMWQEQQAAQNVRPPHQASL